jgi:Flp pilus assembly protein TadD
VRSGAATDAAEGRHRRALTRYRALLATPSGARDADLVLEAAKSARRVDSAEWRSLSAWGHELLGDEMLAKGDLPAALREYRAAVDRAPRDASAHVGLARAHARLGATAEARAALRRAVSLDARVASEARADPDLAPLLD